MPERDPSQDCRGRTDSSRGESIPRTAAQVRALLQDGFGGASRRHISDISDAVSRTRQGTPGPMCSLLARFDSRLLEGKGEGAGAAAITTTPRGVVPPLRSLGRRRMDVEQRPARSALSAWFE
ncbi:hypothetical protein MTO96_047742 [Rhipicephalus appendiculatus]